MGIQQAVTSNVSLEINYVGNHAVKLVGMTDVNQALPVGGFSPGWGNPADPVSAAFACIHSAGDPTPYENSAANTAAEQAARPFTAPCTNPALFAALGAGAPGGSGGPFNPKNSCFSYLQDVSIINNSLMSNYNGLQVTVTGRNFHGVSKSFLG